jgi:hypothetical protein
MRSMARKSKATQQMASAEAALPNRTHFGPGPDANSILNLQRTVGNRTVGQLLQGIFTARSAPRETPWKASLLATPATGVIQRCGIGVDCAGGKAERGSLQRTAADAAATVDVPASVHETLRDGGQPLETATRAMFEARFGHGFGDVRVHTGALASASARAVAARAYTVGRDIVFGAGAYVPTNHEGHRLLAHELAHVLQQKGAARGTPIHVSRTDDPAEREAQTVAGSVLGAERPAPRRLAAIPTHTVQRQTEPRPTPTELQEVQSVRSRHTEENLKPAVTGSKNALERTLSQRKVAIEKELQAVSKFQDQPWAKTKAAALEADLKKTLPDILKSEDSRYLNKELRNDIVKANQAVEKKQVALQKAEEAWHRYDAVFADPDVVKTLAAKQFSPADLKALVAQESFDLTKWNTQGKIVGIAQIGVSEAKEVGGSPKDRLDPNKAIPMAAKILINKARHLEAGLDPIPTGTDYKKFVFASYNAGARTIIEAQKKAKAMQRNAASWEGLVEGEIDSPLYYGIKVALPKEDTAKKYQETRGYVPKIFTRLE